MNTKWQVYQADCQSFKCGCAALSDNRYTPILSSHLSDSGKQSQLIFSVMRRRFHVLPLILSFYDLQVFIDVDN